MSDKQYHYRVTVDMPPSLGGTDAPDITTFLSIGAALSALQLIVNKGSFNPESTIVIEPVAVPKEESPHKLTVCHACEYQYDVKSNACPNCSEPQLFSEPSDAELLPSMHDFIVKNQPEPATAVPPRIISTDSLILPDQYRAQFIANSTPPGYGSQNMILSTLKAVGKNPTSIAIPGVLPHELRLWAETRPPEFDTLLLYDLHQANSATQQEAIRLACLRANVLVTYNPFYVRKLLFEESEMPGRMNVFGNLVQFVGGDHHGEQGKVVEIHWDYKQRDWFYAIKTVPPYSPATITTTCGGFKRVPQPN